MKRFIVSLSMLTIVLGLATLGLHVASAATKDTDVARVTVDWKSYQRFGQTAEIWLLRSFPAATELGHGMYPHQSQRIEYAIDCDQRAYALSQWILTDGQYGTGQVVWGGRAENPDFIKPFAGTLEAALIHSVCEVKTADRLARQQD